MVNKLIYKRITMISCLPVLGFLLTFILNFMTGPGYTDSVNQGAIYIYFMASVTWSVVAFATGAFMYSKCSSMNHLKFLLGVFSVSLGTGMPWLIGMS
jgi:hypothetical protein